MCAICTTKESTKNKVKLLYFVGGNSQIGKYGFSKLCCVKIVNHPKGVMLFL